MRTIRLLPGTLVTALLLAGCNDAPPAARHASTDTPATRHLGGIAFEPCSLPSIAGGPNTEALCATFKVPEDAAAPGGRKIGLNIAWLPVAKGDGTGDPVFFLAGGPGQAATEHATNREADFGGAMHWDGTSWTIQNAGLELDATFETFVRVGDDLLAGGSFGVRRWDGAQWVEELPGTTFMPSLGCARGREAVFVDGWHHAIVREAR